jgi:hypothetical protein
MPDHPQELGLIIVIAAGLIYSLAAMLLRPKQGS